MHLCGDKSDEDNQVIPVYIEKLLRNLLDSTTTIEMNIEFFAREIAIMNGGEPYFGYKQISDIFLTEKGAIKWSVLRQLLLNLKDIYIRSVEAIPNQLNTFKWAESVKVDENVLDHILSEMRIGTAWKRIAIYKPSNSAESLSKLIAYAASFKEHKFILKTETVDNQRGGSCIAFVIGQSPVH